MRLSFAVALVWGLAACKGKPSVEPADCPPPPAVAPAPRPPPVRTPIEPLGPAPAPPDFDEVVDPRPYVFREQILSIVPQPWLATSTLRRDGQRVSLRRVRKVNASDEFSWSGRPQAWRFASVETFVGTVGRAGRYTTFSLTSSLGNSLNLSCRVRRMAVHHPNAMLIRTPRIPGRYYPECSERGVWRPAATQPITVLACVEHEPSGGWDEMTTIFGRSPGVELLGINEDCVLQGSGYRVLVP